MRDVTCETADLLKKIKADPHLRAIPVIILSTSSNEQTIQHALEAGAADFITKPNKLSILEQRLKDVIDNPSYFRHTL